MKASKNASLAHGPSLRVGPGGLPKVRPATKYKSLSYPHALLLQIAHEARDLVRLGAGVEYEARRVSYEGAAAKLLGEEETRRGLDAKWVGMRGLDVRMMAIGGPMR